MTFTSGRYRTHRRSGHRPLALFLPDLRAGGGERVTLTLGQALADLGLEVDLVVANGRGPLRDEVPAEIDIVDLEQDRVRSALPALSHYLRLRAPGWIMPTVDHANLAGSLAVRAARCDTRVVLRPSTMLAQCLSDRHHPIPPISTVLSRHAYRSADALVACSRGMADDLAVYSGVPRERIDVIPNASIGPDLRILARHPLDHPWFQPGAPPVVLGVGRMDEPKDFPLLLEAFAAVRRERAIRLVVVGEGPQRDRVAARAEELGVAEDVALLGFDPNPYRFMARADVFVLASQCEGLPGVLIEALACGAPVVATDCPTGPREILEDGRLGVLTPVGDTAALADAIVHALDRPQVATHGDLSRYEPARVAQAYLKVLERVGDVPQSA